MFVGIADIIREDELKEKIESITDINKPKCLNTILEKIR